MITEDCGIEAILSWVVGAGVAAVAAPLNAFWLIALLCVVGSAWVERVVPETKRQSLDRTHNLWTQARWLFASAGIASIP
jgi:hypothetical protein